MVCGGLGWHVQHATPISFLRVLTCSGVVWDGLGWCGVVTSRGYDAALPLPMPYTCSHMLHRGKAAARRARRVFFFFFFHRTLTQKTIKARRCLRHPCLFMRLGPMARWKGTGKASLLARVLRWWLLSRGFENKL